MYMYIIYICIPYTYYSYSMQQVTDAALSEQTIVTIIIGDVNDNSPVFLNLPVSVNLPENAGLSSEVN